MPDEVPKKRSLKERLRLRALDEGWTLDELDSLRAAFWNFLAAAVVMAGVTVLLFVGGSEIIYIIAGWLLFPGMLIGLVAAFSMADFLKRRKRRLSEARDRMVAEVMKE